MPLRLLVVLDASEASSRALAYLGDFFAFRPSVHFCLTYLMPNVPPELLETGGGEEEEDEKNAEAALHRNRRQWIDSADRTSDAAAERAKAVLTRTGASAQAISTRDTSPLDTLSAVDNLLLAADEQECRTIVVGRHAHSWFDGGRSRLGERLVRDAPAGYAVWVID